MIKVYNDFWCQLDVDRNYYHLTVLINSTTTVGEKENDLANVQTKKE